MVPHRRRRGGGDVWRRFRYTSAARIPFEPLTIRHGHSRHARNPRGLGLLRHCVARVARAPQKDAVCLFSAAALRGGFLFRRIPRIGPRRRKLRVPPLLGRMDRLALLPVRLGLFRLLPCRGDGHLRPGPGRVRHSGNLPRSVTPWQRDPRCRHHCTTMTTPNSTGPLCNAPSEILVNATRRRQLRNLAFGTAAGRRQRHEVMEDLFLEPQRWWGPYSTWSPHSFGRLHSKSSFKGPAFIQSRPTPWARRGGQRPGRL
mmetsp:Transcript_12462/g.41551  ORF Transcript_12462/g.41551 Transcript_12462/m.41551 type:complete len:258 (-) Transcript_12462:1980-2753(-)